jgi:hypothetical protein
VAVEETPKAVGGTVIRTSRSSLLFLCACSGLLAFAAGFVLWDTWSHEEGKQLLPFQLAKDSLLTSFAFVLCVFGGAGCLVAFGYKFLFPHQLIFGEEVLRVIRTGLSGTTVETQVPYAAIAAVACEPEGHGSQRVVVGIDLHRVEAPGIYSCRREFGTKDKTGRHL